MRIILRRLLTFTVAVLMVVSASIPAQATGYATRLFTGTCPLFWGISSVSNANFLCTSQEYVYDTTGKGVDVYVIDSGITKNDPEIGNRLKLQKDFTVDVGTTNENVECFDHGTPIASVAGGVKYGVAKSIDFYSLKVVPCAGMVSGKEPGIPVEGVLEALDWVAKNANPLRRSIVNLSLKLNSNNEAMKLKDKVLFDMGITLIASAGNTEGEDACLSTPANDPNVIVVGGYWQEYVPTAGSRDRQSMLKKVSYPGDQGSCITILAPYKMPALLKSGPASIQGSSYSCPMVVGAVARFFEAHPTATPLAAKAWLLANAKDGTNYLNPTIAGTTTKVLYVPNEINLKPAPIHSVIKSMKKLSSDRYRVTWTQEYAPYNLVAINARVLSVPKQVGNKTYSATLQKWHHSKIYFQFTTASISGEIVMLDRSKYFYLK